MDPRDDSLVGEFQRLQAERAKQEQSLDFIVNQTGEMKEITIMINNELTDSLKIIDEVGTKIDRIDEKLQKNVKKVEEFAKSKNGSLFFVSLVFTLILLGMIYWAIL